MKLKLEVIKKHRGVHFLESVDTLMVATCSSVCVSIRSNGVELWAIILEGAECVMGAVTLFPRIHLNISDMQSFEIVADPRYVEVHARVRRYVGTHPINVDFDNKDWRPA